MAKKTRSRKTKYKKRNPVATLLDGLLTLLDTLLEGVAAAAVAILRGGSNSIWYWFAMYLVSLVVALYIISNDTNPAYQIGWLASLLFLPLVGSALYLILGGSILLLIGIYILLNTLARRQEK